MGVIMFGKSCCRIIMYGYAVITHTTHRLAVAVQVSYRKISIIQYACKYNTKGRGVYNEGAQDSSGTVRDTCTLLLYAVPSHR